MIGQTGAMRKPLIVNSGNVMQSKSSVNHIWHSGFSWISRACVGSLCLSSILLTAQTDATAIPVTADQNLAAIVDRAPAHSTFDLAAGIYRLAAIQPKDGDRFMGQSGAILNGSKILHFEKEGRFWTVVEKLSQSDPKYCLADHPRCFLLSDLFIDNVRQEPAADLEHVGDTSWFYDPSLQKIFLSKDPTGHIVELSKLPAAFYGAGSDIDIENLTIEKYASPPQRGAVGGGGVYASPAQWKLRRMEIRWNHGGGAHVGSGSIIDGCNIHDNGQSGVGGSGDNILVTNNAIDSNNYAGYRVDWEAGAVKFAKTDGLVLRSNMVRNNFGNGLWTDIDNVHLLVEKNTILNNKGEGIRHEIGYDAIIRNNFLRGNKAGIVVAMSSNVQVYGNVIEVPEDGDFGFRLDVGHRQNANGRPYVLENVSVHDNVISYLGPNGRSGLIGSASAAPMVSIDANEYHSEKGGDSNRWRWDNHSVGFDGLQQFGVEIHGKHLRGLRSLPDPTKKTTQ